MNSNATLEKNLIFKYDIHKNNHQMVGPIEWYLELDTAP